MPQRKKRPRKSTQPTRPRQSAAPPLSKDIKRVIEEHLRACERDARERRDDEPDPWVRAQAVAIAESGDEPLFGDFTHGIIAVVKSRYPSASWEAIHIALAALAKERLIYLDPRLSNQHGASVWRHGPPPPGTPIPWFNGSTFVSEPVSSHQSGVAVTTPADTPGRDLVTVDEWAGNVTIHEGFSLVPRQTLPLPPGQTVVGLLQHGSVPDMLGTGGTAHVSGDPSPPAASSIDRSDGSVTARTVPEADRAAPESQTDEVWLSCTEIAKQFGLNKDRLRKRLERYRKTDHGCFRELAEGEGGSGGLRYLWNLNRVRIIVENLRCASAERPSKKKYPQ